MSDKAAARIAPPRAPGTWASWLGVIVLSVLHRLPRGLRRWLASVLAQVTVRSGNRHSRTASINLWACFPDDNANRHDARLRGYFNAFWQTVFLQPRLWWSDNDTLLGDVRFHGLEHLDTAMAAGRPAVLLITHTVALDQGIVAMTSRYPMRGIYKPFENPVVDWLIHRARTRFGGEPAARGNQFRSMMRSFEEGKVLSYLCDEDFGPKGSVFAPFFGRQKATLAMLPRILARAGDVAVVPMATFHDADSDMINVHLWPPIDDYPGTDDHDSATRMNAAIETTIRACPDQFLWKLRIFRTNPAGGPSRYSLIEQSRLSARDL